MAVDGGQHAFAGDAVERVARGVRQASLGGTDDDRLAEWALGGGHGGGHPAEQVTAEPEETRQRLDEATLAVKRLLRM